jgi:NADH:ubiquinone oxidoreductase subunit K
MILGYLFYFLGILIFLITPKFQLDWILILISLEVILLALGLIFIHLSFIFDDFLGAFLTFLILPLAGLESALILILLVAYYPYTRGTLKI